MNTTIPAASDDRSPEVPLGDVEIRECIVNIHNKVSSLRAEMRQVSGEVSAMKVALIGNEFVGGALARLNRVEEHNSEQDKTLEAHDRKFWQWGTIASAVGTAAGFLISVAKDWWHK